MKMIKNEEKININGPITITYLPDKAYFLIEDSFGFKLKFKYGLNQDVKIDKNSEVRIFFIFRGKYKTLIEYNYDINI